MVRQTVDDARAQMLSRSEEINDIVCTETLAKSRDLRRMVNVDVIVHNRMPLIDHEDKTRNIAKFSALVFNLHKRLITALGHMPVPVCVHPDENVRLGDHLD